MTDNNNKTLEKIHNAAKSEFLEKGFKSASLRRIVKNAGMTTGAFYGYYKSKEQLFEALVGEQYDYVMRKYKEAQNVFAQIPHECQPQNLSNASAECMIDILYYANEHKSEFKLLLCCAEGTKYEKMIDEMVEIEIEATNNYKTVLEELGRPSPFIDPKLEHILITGMFNAYFEMIIHDMPLNQARIYLDEMRAFYTAGWNEIMGQK